MSQYLNNIAVTQFDMETKHAYQTMSATLVGTTRERKGVTGSETTFNKMGRGLAKERTAPSADAIPMNVNHGKVTCVLKNYDAPEYTDMFDQKDVLIDEVKELGKTIGGALGRRDDQLKIDAMVAGTYAASPVRDVSGGLVVTAATNLTVDKLREIKKFMDKQGVPSKGRHITVSAEGLEGLLGITQATSADYNNVKTLVDGDVDTFLGFKFHMIDDREEGGLPKTGNIRDGFAWHESAVGYANGIEISTRVDWSTDKDSWKSTGYLKANAVIIDINGVVKYQADES